MLYISHKLYAECMQNSFDVKLEWMRIESNVKSLIYNAVFFNNLQNSFLPTMPQDETAEIKEALLAARMGDDENLAFYRKWNYSLYHTRL